MSTRLIFTMAALLAAAVAVSLCGVLAATAAASPHWSAPVPGPPARLFALGADPFAAGQHRGVDFAARGTVRAACAGRVVFAGRVAGEGTVSTHCGHWRVSYAPLTGIAVREGRWLALGTPLGIVDTPAGLLHFGVRREGRPYGYVDPLRFLAGRRIAPPPVVPVRVRPPRPRPRPHVRPVHLAPALAPWPVWLGLALGLTGLLGAGRFRLPYRRLGGAPCRASSTSNSSPTTPSSP